MIRFHLLPYIRLITLIKLTKINMSVRAQAG